MASRSCRPALSGCGSATIERGRADGFDDAGLRRRSTGAPKDTGTFPNLNIKPQVATTQITPEEKQAQIEALHAAQQDQAATAAASKAPTNPVLLRKLAATHADEALKEIEGQK